MLQLFHIPFKSFNQRLIIVRDGWAHNKLNHWLREFFQSAGSWT